MTDASSVADSFRRWTGRDPAGVWVAPGRVNLIGEHLDYNGGHVLPFAVDDSAWLAVGPRADTVVRCRSAREPDAVATDLGDLGRATGWSAYLLGAAWALQQEGVAVAGADMYLDSDIPPGGGLGSSAALGVATAMAVSDLAGAALGADAVAAAAHRGETEVVGAPVGVMDQAVCVRAQVGHALYLDCRHGGAEQIPLPVGDARRILVVDTGTAHQLRSSGYGATRRACEAAAAMLGVRLLTDATLEHLDRLDRLDRLDHALAGPARHVIGEEARTQEAAARLQAGDLAGIGPLLSASHRSLRDDLAVSTATLDAVVDAAVAAGADGARLTGGGFGGTAVVLTGRRSADPVEAAVRAALGLYGRRPSAVRTVRPAAGARRAA